MATEKQIAYINDLIANHIANLDVCTASWDAWQAERGPSEDAADYVSLYTQVRAVFAAMTVSADMDNERASGVIAALKLGTGQVLLELATRRLKSAAALGVSPDAALAKRAYRLGVQGR